MLYCDNSTRVRGTSAGESCRGARVYNVLEPIGMFSPSETLGESGFNDRLCWTRWLVRRGGGQCAEGSSVT